MAKYKEPKNKAYKLTPFWIKAIATALAKQHKVKIERGDVWAMDMKNKVLVYTDDICFLDEDNVLALLLHEIGHIRFSEWYDETTDIYKEAPEASQNCINACEDVRIDHIVSRQYEGSYTLIDTLQSQAVNDGLSKIIEHKAKVAENIKALESFKLQLGEANEMLKKNAISSAEVKKFIEDNEPQISGRISPVAEVMYIMLAIHYGYDNHPTIATYKDENPVLLEKAYLCADQLKIHQIEFLENTKAVQTFYEEYIYPIIKDLIEKNKDGSEKKFDKGSGRKGQQQVDANGNPIPGQGDPGQKLSQSRGKAMAERAKNQVDKALGKGSKPAHNTPNSGHISYDDFYQEIKDYITASSSKFNRILKDNKFDRYAGRFRTGELNKRRLYKYKTHDYKLFQRKTERKNKDYAFSVMMDVSGSMSGTRATESFKGVALMCEVLHRCGVPYEICFFASGHRFGKKFDEQLSRMKVGQKASEVWDGGTDIIDPFTELVKNMNARKEEHKIIVVLTDGQVGGDEENRVLKIIRKNTDIDYYGIGIGVDLNSLFGRNSVDVADVSEVVPKFASILKNHIKTG